MGSAGFAKLAPGIAAGFVSAYGLWTALTINSDQKLPKSVTNQAWSAATEKLLDSMPRQGSAVPVVMNPGRFL